jgi:uncharacterized protein YecT (DUF1311 family)
MSTLLFVAGILLGSAALARAADTDPIDAQLNVCLNSKKADTTAGQLDCIGEANAARDKRLNSAYQSLMKTLDPKSRDLLQTAQRAWLDYRAKEADFAGGPGRANTGTLAMVTIGSSHLEELRARVLTLETYAHSGVDPADGAR